MTTMHISPAQSLIHNGVGIFHRLNDVENFHTPHIMTMTMLIVCETGELTGTIDAGRHTLRPGSIMALSPGHTIHDIRESRDFVGCYIVADNDKLNGLLPLTSYIAPCLAYFKDNPIIAIDPDEMTNLLLMVRLLHRKNGSEGSLPYNQLTVKALCEAIFYETIGVYTSVMNRRGSTPSRREVMLSQFIALLEKDFRKERTVAYYARRMCVSPKHLSAMVKSVGGLTAGEWIDRKVVLEAKTLLRNTGMTVQEIAASLHFPNQSFFGKYFKHHTGCSPRYFRTHPDL